jgi:hypothetical protein
MHRVNNDAGGTLDLERTTRVARKPLIRSCGADDGPERGFVDRLRLTSSAAALNASSSHRTALAVVGGSDYVTLGVGTSFHGQAVNPGAVVIKYTYEGDVNLDGTVNVADLGILSTNWQRSGNWTRGDFNYDGTINVADLGMLASSGCRN